MKNMLLICIFLMSLHRVSAQNTIERETLVYSVKEGKELHMDKYVDKSIAFSGKRPVMIYIHGGGFSKGSRINALQIKYCKHFATQGYVAFCMDYRLGIKDGTQPSQEIILNAVKIACEDLFDATAFILKKADLWNIDEKKIIISGGSAGAITCLTAEYIICSDDPSVNRLPKDFNYGGVISHAGCVIVKLDTLTWKKAPCPMLLMHGSKDQLVTFESIKFPGVLYAGSNYIHKQFLKSNSPHWLYEETGADHIVALKPLQYNFAEIDAYTNKFVMKGQHSIVHTIWADEKPDSMGDMQKVVPLYIIGWDKTDDEVNMDEK
ncbi:MAG: alpha/beta hydrolase [Bacteroidales bacterium]|nr:alpha/beta hydrolase [Bacteroidales bacterium]